MNKDKIILDLCGGTGAWSRPYKDAGYRELIKKIGNQETYRISGKCNHKSWQWINPFVKLCNKCKRTNDSMPEMKPDWGDWDSTQEWTYYVVN